MLINIRSLHRVLPKHTLLYRRQVYLNTSTHTLPDKTM